LFRIAQFKAKVQKDAKKKAEQRQKEAQKRELENLNRKHLQGIRVVQKNLVYVVGLSHGIPENELLQTLRGDKYFGQYGKILKIVVSKSKQSDANNGGSLGVYVTFARDEDAAKCIAAVNGSTNLDRVLRAQFGTTKYCSAYIRNETCTNKQCMFLHEPGDNEESYSRQDLSSINSVGTQRPLTTTASSSRQAAQIQAPLQHQPVAAAPQHMTREPSKDGSDNGDGSALPSSASWGNRGAQQRSRRGSIATSGAAPSPAVSTAISARAEVAEELQEASDDHQRNTFDDSADAGSSAVPTSPVSTRATVNPILMDLVKSISSLGARPQSPSEISPEDLEALSQFPSLFDDEAGLKRLAVREQQEEAQLHIEQESQSDSRPIPEPQEEEAPESGSLQLGGEPEDRDDSREGSSQPQGFHDHRRPSAQLPIQRVSNDGVMFGNLGQNFPQNLSLASINGRALTPLQQQQLLLLKSSQPQSGFIDQFPPGMGPSLGPSQSSLFQQQGHNRQSSRYSFASEAPTSSSLKPSNPKLVTQSSMMMSQQGSPFYGSSIPGPPPGLKSTSTPPISAGGMFNQNHGFGGAQGGNFSASKENSNEMLREMLRNRGGVGGGQGHDAGKREFMFPSFLHQYPSTSTPAPASGLLASLYGSQPGAFHDFGPKQKKKGKKHRHANTSSSGGGVLVDLADPNILQARMPLPQQQSNAGVGQGLFGGQGQGGYSQNMMYGSAFQRW
jgi:CCR4-NOT transcription complex subunit 4